VWLRFRGSNRADNVSATPEDECDIWSLRLGELFLGRHTTMCFFSCRIDSRSVSLFDGATSDRNFAHAWLVHYIHRIQARNLNVFGVVNIHVPIRHMNLAPFQLVKDSVARDGNNGA
jgi:hypothetical protein